MLRAQREKILAELTDTLKEYNILYLVDYQGLDVAQITELRKKLRESGAKLRVAKNTLMQIAREQSGGSTFPAELFAGPSAFIMAKDDPISPAKVIKAFLEDHDKPQVKAIFINDEVHPHEKYEEYAKLPGLTELQAKLVGSLNAPIYGLVALMSNLMRGFVTQIDQLSQKEGE